MKVRRKVSVPGAPWLAAAVTRVEAFDLVQRYAGKFPGMESGDFPSYAELVSSLLYSNAAEYAAERKKKKNKDRPPLPGPPSEGECYTSSTQCTDGSVIPQTCCPVEESLGSVYLCTPSCASELAVMGSETSDF